MNCGTAKALQLPGGKTVSVPTELIGRIPFQKGESRDSRKNKQQGAVGPTPPGHGLMRAASVPEEGAPSEMEQDEEIDQAIVKDENAEFKQALEGPGHDPLAKLKEHVRQHDNRKRSFDALFGGPESDYLQSNGIL